MRRLWLPLGFALGALFVYALTHEARKLFRLTEEQNKKMAAFRKETRLALARKGAIHGVDYLSDTFIEEELEKYKDVYAAWERGDFDEYPIE